MDYSNYRHEDDKPHSTLEEKEYRCFIANAEEQMSKTGKEMLVVTLKVGSSNNTLKEFFVNGEYFNRKISRFFDSFPSIGDGNFNLIEWIGAEGGVKLKKDGEYHRVHYFLRPDEWQKLPEFVGEKPQKMEFTQLPADDAGDDDFPFI